MGLETIASEVLIIGAFLYFAVILVNSFNDNWISVHNSLKEQNDLIREKLDEEVSIYSVVYDSTNNETDIVLQNSGRRKISMEHVDIFMDDTRIPRDNSNRTFVLRSSSEIKNPGIWDPTELVDVTVDMHLSSGTHFVEVFTKMANKDITTFEVI